MSLQKLTILEHFKNILTNITSTRITHIMRQVSCWQCKARTENLICENCKEVQDYKKYNYFEILDLPVSFEISNKSLISKYHKLQSVFHPDKHSNKSEKEKAISASNSVIINKAYSVLLNPLDRGFYILKIRNYDLSIESPDRNFLMIILKLNDDISRISIQRHYFKVAKQVQQEITNLTFQISEAFKKDDLENVKKLLTSLRYFSNVLNKAKERMDMLGLCIE